MGDMSSNKSRDFPTTPDGIGGNLPPLQLQDKCLVNKNYSGSSSIYPVKLSLQNDDSIKNDLITYNVRRILRREPPREKYIFPATSSESYGWSWNNDSADARGGKALDRFARIAPGRMNTLSWWGGDRESLP
jgi:hypothetical protein